VIAQKGFWINLKKEEKLELTQPSEQIANSYE
jgi:hypothetical protein